MSAPRVDGSRYESLAAVFGTLVVLAAIGFLLYDALGAPPSPPQLSIRVDSVIEAGDGYLVEFSAVNRGRSTAATLMVDAELLDGERTVESARASLDYVPEQAERSGGVYFREDPRRYRLEIHARGYEVP